MIEIQFLENEKEVFPSQKLYQWDFGISLKIKGVTASNNVQVHFKYNDIAVITVPTISDDSIVVNIPNEILTVAGILKIYLYYTDDTSGYTYRVITLNVQSREKPEDYVPTNNNPTLAQLLQTINSKADKDDLKDFVDDYLEENPIEGVTDEQIAAAISDYLEENPIDTLTQDEVNTIVSNYISQNISSLKGDDGNDGVSPTINVTQSTDGYILKITDANGTQSILVKNGKDGADGSAGVDGDFIPKQPAINSSWWATKSGVTGTYIKYSPENIAYNYSKNEDGFYSPIYQNCDIYQMGVLADGTTNNANARIYNEFGSGNLFLKDGMYVAVCGGEQGNNRWHSYDGNVGGHVFEGWSNDGVYRATILLNEPKKDDGMKEIALFCWDRRMRDFGWVRLGCDGMYTKNADGTYSIKDTDKEGLSVTRTFAIAHTPMQFEPMKKPVYMPEFVPNRLQTDSNRTQVGTGTIYFDEDDNKLKIKIGTKWYKFVLEEETSGGESSSESQSQPESQSRSESISQSESQSQSESEATSESQSQSDSSSSSETPTTYTVLPASKTGLSQDYTIDDGNEYFAVFKWGDTDYIVTSSRAIGYNGGQFRARSGIPANVYANGSLTSMSGTETNLGIAWGISADTIKANHNMIHYTNNSSADDSAATVTFEKNYE